MQYEHGSVGKAKTDRLSETDGPLSFSASRTACFCISISRRTLQVSSQAASRSRRRSAGKTARACTAVTVTKTGGKSVDR